MILFWGLGALAAAATLLYLLWPLLRRPGGPSVSRREANVSIYRDQRRELDADLAAGKLAPADYERARTELEARLLADVDAAGAEPAARPRARTGVAIALAALLPATALVVYLAVGNPGAIVAPAEHDIGPLVARLEAHLQANPDDAQGWAILARTYAALERFPEAVDAYAKAVLGAPKDARLLADFADALAMARGATLQGEPEKLALRALELDPGNLKALALAGTAAFERQDYPRAAELWKRMLAHVPPGSEEARAIESNVNEALAAAKAKPLSGTVALAPKLKDQVSPEDTVFIYARAAEGPPMPLAVQRVRVRDLPAKFSLTDAMAMAPGMNLSAHPRVVVTARVSKSGQAAPQPGDLQGASAPVANDATGVAVLIDRVVP